jgi:class 3 adenylate cyclase
VLFAHAEKAPRINSIKPCGPALVGSFASQLRLDFTAIGSAVNVASRVESQAKAGEILITSICVGSGRQL